MCSSPVSDVARHRGRDYFRMASVCWFLFILIASTSVVEAFCPSQCQCNDAALETDCSSARLDVVPILLNPALRSLRLAGNRITTIRQSLGFYADLEVLDLSNNALTELGQKQLESQKVLRWLNLSFNAIGSLESRAFLGLGQLEVLDLRNNELASVEAAVFSDLTELADLDLSYNRIERLSDECFASLGRLRSLDLSHNRLQQLAPSPGSWSPLSGSLLQLDLSHNLLAQLDGGDGGLSALTELRQLSLAGNQLHHIHFAAFDGLVRLMEMDLSSNRLEYVPSDALSPLGGSLRSLDLSSNYMSHVGSGAFAELVQLESLRISDVATLVSVHRDALSSLNGSLQTLVLSNNRRWRSMDPHLLSSLLSTHLRYVDLSGNGLETVGRPTTGHWPPSNLEYFDLSGNPLECNCSMHWLWDHRRHSNSSLVPMKDIVCQGPAPLAGRHFFQLEESHLICWSSATILLIALVSGLVLTVLAGLLVLCFWHRRRKSLDGLRQKQQQQQKESKLSGVVVSCPTPTHHHVVKQHLTNNMLSAGQHHHHHHHHIYQQPLQLPDSPPLKSKTLSLPKTVDYYLNEDDYVYHPGGHLVKPIPVTAV